MVEIYKKDAAAPVEKPDEKGFVEGYASVYSVVDKQGERVIPGAFANALANPSSVKYIWQHKFEMPIGHIEKLWEDDIGLKYRAKLNLKTDWGRNAYYALLAGDVTANSIGYDLPRGKSISADDGIVDLGSINLWEVSPVTFPSNEEAVVNVVKSNTTETSETNPEETQETIETKDALPYKKTPLAPEGEAWDGGAEVAAASLDDLKMMCACMRGDQNNKTSYALPHHKADGDYACVWKGVAAAYAALQGGRTGTPMQGCNGAEAHLLKHYDDFEKPRPGKSEEPEFDKTGKIQANRNETKLRQMRDIIDSMLSELAQEEPGKSDTPETEGTSDEQPDELKAIILRLEKIDDIFSIESN